jgi:hypothetical protein
MAITRHIKYWAGSAEIELCYSHLALCRLTDIRYEMPNFLNPQPL